MSIYAEKFELITGRHVSGMRWENPNIEKKLWFLPVLSLLIGSFMLISYKAYEIIPSIIFHSLATFITEAIILFIMTTHMVDFRALWEERKDSFFEYMVNQFDTEPIAAIMILCITMIAILLVYAISTRQWPFLFQVVITCISYSIVVVESGKFQIFHEMSRHIDELKKRDPLDFIKVLVKEKVELF